MTSIVFFFNDTATTEIYTLSLHDALPISRASSTRCRSSRPWNWPTCCARTADILDRKSTRLNSSHQIISYAVFCLKKQHLTALRKPAHKVYHVTSLSALQQRILALLGFPSTVYSTLALHSAKLTFKISEP